MTTGPPFSWPLPTGADVPDVPRHLGDLGGAISDTLSVFGITGDKQLQSGARIVTPDGSGFAQITYTKPFASVPLVVVTLGDLGLAYTVQVVYTPTTKDAVTVALFDEAGQPVTTGNYRVNWIAVGTPA